MTTGEWIGVVLGAVSLALGGVALGLSIKYSSDAKRDMTEVRDYVVKTSTMINSIVGRVEVISKLEGLLLGRQEQKPTSSEGLERGGRLTAPRGAPADDVDAAKLGPEPSGGHAARQSQREPIDTSILDTLHGPGEVTIAQLLLSLSDRFAREAVFSGLRRLQEQGLITASQSEFSSGTRITLRTPATA